jgi:hypothetical protein
MRDNLQGRKRVITLRLTQSGNCTMCHQKLTENLQWRLHYINRKLDAAAVIYRT